MKSFAVVMLVCLVVAAESDFPHLQPGVPHGSCEVDWTFSMKCSDVNAAIVKQIKAWKVNYKLWWSNPTQMKVSRVTSQHFQDDFTFTFEQKTNMCKVHGHSEWVTWFVFDLDNNYCDMFNVLEGAGLVNTAGYTETTSDKICTKYSSRNCSAHKNS
ncbi:uncharacterized protein [Haliotis asinina]|uniref:uncharacterized protein n=1 Tax=Haliotis asinina TaxID=109174 RepID=UPI003531BE74